SDNWGNAYPRLGLCSTGKSDRYKPHESTTEVVTVAAHEFVDDLRELRMSFDGGRNVFSIRDPLMRRRDMRQRQAEANPSELAVRVGQNYNAAVDVTTTISSGPTAATETRPQVIREVKP